MRGDNVMGFATPQALAGSRMVRAGVEGDGNGSRRRKRLSGQMGVIGVEMSQGRGRGGRMGDLGFLIGFIFLVGVCLRFR